MENFEKAQEISDIYMPDTGFTKEDLYDAAMEMAQWKDEQLNSIKDEIQSNLCASSGFNDEYSRGYQDCGMKVMEMIDKILEV